MAEHAESLELVKPIRIMSDEDAVEMIMSTFKQAQSDKGPDITRCKRYRKIYEAQNQSDEVIDETKGGLADDRRIYSNTYLPLGAAVVDTASSAIYNSFFSVPDYFEMEASEVLDDLAAQRLTAHQMKRHKEMKFRHTCYDAIQSALTFDYAVTMTTWKLKPGFVPTKVLKEESRQLGPIRRKHRDVRMDMKWVPDKVDRSDLVLFDFFNCYHDIRAKNGFEDSEFFFDVRYPTVNSMLAEQETTGKYKNIREAWKNWADMSIKLDKDDPVDRTTLVKSKRLRVIRYWTQDHVVEIAGEKVIFRKDLRGMPLQLWRIHHLSSEFRGMGILQRIERPQYDINAIINLRRDFQNLALNPIAIISEHLADLNDSKVELYPGRTFIGPDNVAKMGDLIHFSQPGIDIAQSSNNELNIQVEATKMVSGFGDNQMAQFSGGRTTARETSAVAAGALSKVFTVASRLEELCLEPIYQEIFLLEQAFMSKSQQFKYFGQKGMEWVQVTPEDYRWTAMPTFMAKGTTIIRDREIHIQQFMVAVDRAMQFPQVHNLPAIFLEMWKLLSPKNYHQFIKDPGEKNINIPPETENIMLAMGRPVEIQPQNDNAEHSRVHSQMINGQDFKLWPQARQQQAIDHKTAHDQAAQAEAAQQLGNALGGGGVPGQNQAGVGQGAIPQAGQGLRAAEVGVTP